MTDQQHIADKPARDSMFGVCAAVANDFGFNPLWLRLAIGAALMWNLEVALATYATLGVIVLISRLAAPDARAEAPVEAPAAVTAASQQDNAAIELQRAA
jgi:phage shock protein C